jgi:hypothetical protein
MPSVARVVSAALATTTRTQDERNGPNAFIPPDNGALAARSLLDEMS